jgi:hydroxyethylthiazole kinase-like uncharacterized protein yjeF
MALIRPALPLFDAEGSRAVDRWAIDEQGIAGVALMRHAARAAARVARGRFPDARRIAVVCGSGANGGDGFEVARLLRNQGRDAVIVRVAEREAEGDAAAMLQSARAAGVPVDLRPDGRIADALVEMDLIVDALLGTGTRGAPRGAVDTAIAAIGQSGRPVLALDVPSGVDASTGEVPGLAVVAEITVTFHAGKPGLWIAPGRNHAGTVVVAPIGIPAGAPIEPAAVAVDDATDLIPGRSAGGSKYDAGAVLVVGGAPGMAGAPSLAASAALRAGAGLVHVLVPDEVRPLVAGWSREAMVHDVGTDPAGRIADLAGRVDAVAVGPGLGREVPAERILAAVLDLRAPTVITPHAGEAARLLGVDSAVIAEHRRASALRLAEDGGVVALLKGADTIVVDPGGRLAVRGGVCAALATAGSGDVLTGIIAALLARGCDPWTAAIAGAVEHLHAGRRAVASRRGGAIMAGDLIDALFVGTEADDRHGGDR